MKLPSWVERHRVASSIVTVLAFLVVTFPIWLAQIWPLFSARVFADVMRENDWGLPVVAPLYGWFAVALVAFGVAALFIILKAGHAARPPERDRDQPDVEGRLPTAVGPLVSAPERQANRVEIAWSNQHDGDGLRATITNLTSEMLFPPNVMNAGLPQHSAMNVLVVDVRRWSDRARAFVPVPGIELSCSKRTRIQMGEAMFPDLAYGFPLVHFKPRGAGSDESVTIVGRSEDVRYPPVIGTQEGTWRITLRAEFPGHQETHELCLRYVKNLPPVPLDSCIGDDHRHSMRRESLTGFLNDPRLKARDSRST